MVDRREWRRGIGRSGGLLAFGLGLKKVVLWTGHFHFYFGYTMLRGILYGLGTDAAPTLCYHRQQSCQEFLEIREDHSNEGIMPSSATPQLEGKDAKANSEDKRALHLNVAAKVKKVMPNVNLKARAAATVRFAESAPFRGASVDNLGESIDDGSGGDATDGVSTSSRSNNKPQIVTSQSATKRDSSENSPMNQSSDRGGNDQQSASNTIKSESLSASLLLSSVASNNNLAAPFLVVGVAYTFHISYQYKAAILTNQIPICVMIPWLAVAFFLGRYMNENATLYRLDTELRTQQHQREMTDVSNDISRATSGESSDTTTATHANNKNSSRTRNIVRQIPLGRRHVHRIKQHLQNQRSNTNNGTPNNFFWTNISPRAVVGEVKELEQHLLKPISDVLMDHLLKDFGRRRQRSRKELDEESIEQPMPPSTNTTSIRDSIKAIGHQQLPNAGASSFESDDNVIEPIGKLRGMDLFLTDDPEVEIWRQPLLNQCGLRDTPTFIGNIMLPFGNLTVYFKLPKWFDDDNIPPEMDDDPPDVKALKRFLMGDDEYKNKRAKLVPYIVDAPLAIRMIKPKPIEITIHGDRHPLTWSSVPKCVDPTTGERTASALLECDVDLLSSSPIRKIINIVRPHLPKITIDIAMVISKPWGSVIEEPSCCLGVWRIDKVDFESCAVFPQSRKSVEEAADEMKSLIAILEEEAENTNQDLRTSMQ